MRPATWTILDGNGEVLWAAQPGPQQDVFNLAFARKDPANEILIGGARGGGKTAVMTAFMLCHVDNPEFVGLVLRKTAESLKEWVDKAYELYKHLGAKKVDKPTQFVFPSGARIHTAHFKDERSLEDVKGHEYHFIALEEATQISSARMYEWLLGSNRSTVKGISPKILLTTNPDGPGNGWVRRRFVDVEINGQLIAHKTRFKAGGRIRVFVPARVHDNPILEERNPEYVEWLRNIENEALRKAWYDGDWNCMEGAFFPEFRPTGPYAGEPERANHVIAAVDIPAWCHRWAAIDWGYMHHSAVYWAAIAPDRRTHVYREMLVRQWSAEDFGMEFAKRTLPDLEEQPDRTMTVYLSHDAFGTRNTGKTIAEQIQTGIERIVGPNSVFILQRTEEERKLAFNDLGGANAMMIARMEEQLGGARIVIKRSSADRTAQASQVRRYLNWRTEVEIVEPDMKYAAQLLSEHDGYEKHRAYLAKFEAQRRRVPVPMLQIHSVCRHLIEVFPRLQPDPKNLEAVRKFDNRSSDPMNTQVGDDPFDALCYLLMGGVEQQNDVPFHVYLTSQIERLLPSGDNDINLKIQIAQAARKKFEGQRVPTVIECLGRASMESRWTN